MRNPDEMPRGVRRLLRLGASDRELDDELADHFRRLEEDLVREGMDPRDAEREARRRFGDETRYRRRIRAIDRSAQRRRGVLGFLDASRDACAAALRGLRASPGLSLAIILAFTLGIGANATVYGILDRLLLSPPPHVQDPDGIVRLRVQRSALGQVFTTSTLALADVGDFEASPYLSNVAAYTTPRPFTIGRGESAEPAPGSMATADLFPLLGVRPLLGRLFDDGDDASGAQGVVVIGADYWWRAFGGSRDVIGTTVDFGYGEYEVIGVAPRGFTGIDLEAVDLWLPLRQAAPRILPSAEWLSRRGAYFVRAVARLAEGATIAQAAEDATRRHRLGREEQITRGVYDAEARVVPGPVIAARGDDPGDEARVARWLAGVSLVVLLIGCINVANLLLARALRRRRETAIRLALGVSRQRLIGDAIVESTLLAVLGGVAALAAARWGGDIVRSTLMPEVDWSTATLNVRLAAFVFGLAIVAGFASAIVPALQATRGDVNDALRASAGAITRSALRTRGFLSLAQTALSVLLLVGAGLFVRSLTRVGETDMGFVPENLLAATVVTDGIGGLDGDELRRFFADAAERVQRLAFVRSAAAASVAPMRSSWTYPLRVPGLDSIPRQPTGGPYGHAVSPGYFETMGIRVVRGRAFDDTDREGAPPAFIVNEAFADLVWPGENALDKCVHVGEDEPGAACAQVVGVVATARRATIEEIPTAQFYVPLAQRLVETAPGVLFVRVTEQPRTHASAVRRTLLDMEPRLRHAQVQPLLDFAAEQLRPWRLGATLFTAFGAIALLVAALGLYSVLAFDVAQRVREIGLRSALGARLIDLVRLVVARAAAITAGGIAAGLAAALLLAPRLDELLYQVDAHDPITFAAVGVVLILVATAASAIPAWRAARVDPNVALRSE